MRVLQARGHLDLAQEAFRAEGLCERRIQHLERDGAAVYEVAGEINGSHPARAELSLDQVSVGQCDLEQAGDAGHARKDGGKRRAWPARPN